MDVEREITVTLTPEEVEEILKKYLKEEKGFEIESVSFNTGTKYYGQMDQHGTTVVTNITCKGKI